MIFLTETMDSGGNGQNAADNIPPYEIEVAHGRHVFGRRLLRRFGEHARDVVYDVSIVRDNWQGSRLINLTAEMTQMWRDVLDTVREDGVDDMDQIRIHISHRRLRRGDIKIPLQRFRDITPEGIMEIISNILQSFDHLLADDMLEISVGIIKIPHGNGGEY